MVEQELHLAMFLGLLRAVVRAMSLMLALPPIGVRAIPASARVLLALFVGPLAWLPLAGDPGWIPGTPVAYLAALGSDVLLGVTLGFTLRIAIAGAAAAGALIGLQAGLTMSATYDPDSGTRHDSVARLTEWLAIAVALATGLHRDVLLAASSVFRPDAGVDFASLPRLAASTDDVLVLGLLLAAPVLACLLLTDVVLAIAARLVPQVQAMAVAWPAKLLVVLGALTAALPIIVRVLSAHLARIPTAWAHLAGGS